MNKNRQKIATTSILYEHHWQFCTTRRSASNEREGRGVPETATPSPEGRPLGPVDRHRAGERTAGRCWRDSRATIGRCVTDDPSGPCRTRSPQVAFPRIDVRLRLRSLAFAWFARPRVDACCAGDPARLHEVRPADHQARTPKVPNHAPEADRTIGTVRVDPTALQGASHLTESFEIIDACEFALVMSPPPDTVSGITRVVLSWVAQGTDGLLEGAPLASCGRRPKPQVCQIRP